MDTTATLIVSFSLAQLQSLDPLFASSLVPSYQQLITQQITLLTQG